MITLRLHIPFALLVSLMLLLLGPARINAQAVEATQTYQNSTETSSHTITIPTGVVAGDRLVMIVRVARGRTITSFPSSWTLLDSRSSTDVTYVYTKIAAASETNVSVGLSNSARIAAVTYWISGSDSQTDPEVAFAGSNTNNPPSLTPSWGAVSTLYLIGLTNRVTNTSVTSASVPANYTDFVTATNSSNSSNRYVRVSSARRTSLVTSGAAENPGAFNVTLDNPHAITIAVKAQPPVLTLSAPANTTVGTRVSYTVTRSISTGNATVNLSSTGTSGAFYASSTSTTPISSLSIANGSTSGTVWFTATTAGTYTVSVAASGYDGASDEITFSPGTPTTLRFVQQPTTTIVDAAIQPAVSVEVVDAFGNRVTSSTNVVTLQLESNPGTATLSGTLSRVATNGLAIFNDVSLSQPEIGYTVRATSSGLAAAVSDPFDVLVLSLNVFANPSSIPADGTSTSAITLTVTDSQGNPQSGRSVTVQTDNGILLDGANALSGPTTFQTDANGIVSLSLQAATLAGTARITATLTGTSIEAMATVAFTDLPVLSADFTEIDISNLVLESGTDLQPGSVYLKTNAITIDGQQVDVRLSIFARESAVTDVLLDNDAVNPTRFQPELNANSASGAFMDFDLRFYVGAAQVRLKDFFVNPVDVDGSSSTVSEYIELVDFTSYSLDATSQIVVQTGVRPGFTRFFGRPSSLNDISFDNTASFIASYEEPVTVLPLRIGYTGSTTARRQHSIQFGVNAGEFTNPQITEKPRLLYEVTTYVESDSDDGSIITTGPITLLYPNGISFTGSNGGSIPGVTFANIPAGLTPVVTRVSDIEAVLSFTGNAVESGNGDDVTNVTVTFGNASFSNGNATVVNGATRNNLVIDFFDLGVPDLSQSTLTANPVQIPADGLTSSTITLRLKDGAGRSISLSGLNITMMSTLGTLSEVTDNGNGTYSAVLISLDEGTAVIRAKLDGVDFEASATVLLVPAGKIYRTRASGSWNDVSIWERFNNGSWIPATLFPVAATPVTVTQAPIVGSSQVSISTSTNTTNHSVALPTGIESGDLLLFFWMDENDGSTLGNLPSGWTTLYNVNTSNYRRVAMYRVADGTEPTSFTVTTSTGETSARVVMRILKDTYQDVPVASDVATGSSSSPNPPSLDSGFSDVPTLWIAASHSTGDDNAPLPTAPSGYTDLATAWSGSTGTSHARMATAYRVTQAAATEDPGAFTLGSSVTWYAHTIAVRGKNTLVTPAATSALVDSLHQVTVTAPLTMDNITVDSGGELRITGSNVTITSGNQLIVEAAGILKLQSGNGVLQGEGSFISRSGSFIHTVSPDGFALTEALGKIRTQTRVYSTGANYVFDGTSAQVTGTGMPSVIHSLVVSNAAGVTLSQDVNVVGNLSLISGRLTVPSDRQLQLTAPNHVSSPSDLGDILLLEGAGYLNSSRQTPRLTVRETLTGLKGWRMLSSPVVTTYADMFQGLVTQGFSGSGFPSLSTNLMWWDESDKGTTLQGWRTPASLNSAIPAGRGHFHYVFDGAPRPDAPSQSYSDALPVTIEVNGAEPLFNANNGSRFDWAITSSPRDTTNQSGAMYVDRVTADAGWNLIGNPTASTLNWDANNGWTKTRLSNTIYVWDPAINDYRVWNGTSGNLGSGLIAPFQAFWVKATNTNPSLTMSNAAKTLVSTTFRGKEADSTVADVSVLTFRMDVDGRQSQTWLQFSESGRLGFDGQDAFRLSSPNTSWVTLHTRAPSADAAPMQINHLPTTFDEPTHLDLEIGAVNDLEPVSGTFTLSWTRSDTWRDDLHVVLMDHETRTTRELSADGTVTFEYETPRSFAAKSAGGESLTLPASPVAGSDVRAKLSETAYSRQTRFSLVVSNQPLDQYLPRTVALDQNYPNPFNPSTSIRFHLPETQRVRIDLFDMLGRHIGTLADGEYGAGSHQVDWNAAGLSSGVYLYRLSSGSEVITRKMTLLK